MTARPLTHVSPAEVPPDTGMARAGFDEPEPSVLWPGGFFFALSQEFACGVS